MESKPILPTVPKKKKNEPAAVAPASILPASAAAKPGRKRAASSKSDPRKSSSKKNTPTGGVKKATVRRIADKASAPSDAEIRTRAYFIAERRMQLAIPGDSAHDWLEAKQQLIAAASKVHA